MLCYDGQHFLLEQATLLTCAGDLQRQSRKETRVNRLARRWRRDTDKYTNALTPRPIGCKEKSRGRGGEIGGGLPKWSFALEVVAVEMREVLIRALSANRLYGLPFFLRYQKTWTQYSQEMGFTLSQCEAAAFSLYLEWKSSWWSSHFGVALSYGCFVGFFFSLPLFLLETNLYAIPPG